MVDEDRELVFGFFPVRTDANPIGLTMEHIGAVERAFRVDVAEAFAIRGGADQEG